MSVELRSLRKLPIRGRPNSRHRLQVLVSIGLPYIRPVNVPLVTMAIARRNASVLMYLRRT